MDTKKKVIETFLFSTVGVVGMIVLLIAVNVIFDALNIRVDMTEENLYTLSPGTKQILKGMDTPVNIRYYFSKDAAQMPVYLKNYAQRVEDLLKEYREVAGGNVAIEKLNPKPDSDAEDSANLDGVHGQSAGLAGDKIYLGLAISCLDEVVSLPFLSPERENLLEYDITRAVYRVLHPEKAVVGIMSSLSVMGQQQPPMMPMGGPQQNKPAWIMVSELKRDFEVREVSTDIESVDDDIDVLMLVHATNLPDKTLFAIDQFVLRGGRLLAFLDAMSMVERQERPQQMPQMQMPPASSTLGVLLDAWGVEFETEKVVADLQYMTRVQGRDGGPESMPMVLSLNKETVDADDPATGQLESLLYVFGGVFSGDGIDSLKKTVLLHTSEDSQLIEKFMAQMPGDSVVKDFKPEEREQALGIRLTGTFKTAFPEGKPGDAGGDAEDGDASTDADKDADDKAKADDAKADDGLLRESAQEGVVVLIGDADMIYDHFCVRRQSFFGQEVINPMNDNLTLVQNLLEQLSGDNNLISIRSRGAIARPFLVVQRMKAEAEQKYQEKIKALEDDLSEVQRKIGELQREKSKDQQYILSSEQQRQIEKFRQKEGEVRKELKGVRKKFRRDIDALENRLKWANIALMPFLVGMSGIVLAMAQRRRMVRK